MSKLAVEVKTNYEAGIEFKFVQVQLFISQGGPLFGSFTEAHTGDAFARGHRVCDIDGINQDGDYHLVVVLLSAALIPVASGRKSISISSNSGTLVEIIKSPTVVERVGFRTPPPIIPR